ncbi:DUF222 domain-containing protein [Gordonia sp. TBRC 11910]|uniref:DUF222 domain-containing protein n=1 Tax=Gordonia asplenii TaxID=2725283 RepID=A0A848KVW9_9ACTN|nr:DUF222 domain-containing protein [Gordonia asplenii]NMO02429.1 DUF222 domain-containing protein [Gordonia asplenii]
MSTSRDSVPPSRATVSRYGWASEDPGRIGLHLATDKVAEDAACGHINDLMDAITTCRAGESFLLWTKYRALAGIHDQLAGGCGDGDARLVSQQSQVAARYAMTGAISPQVSARHVNEAVAMVHRLPRTGERLRDGVIAAWQFTRIVSRSDLIDGYGYRAAVDEEIARRVGRGSWSGKRLDALVDSAIFRHDPDAVRRRHHLAKEGRTVTTDPLADGMAELRATATVEDVATAFAAIDALITRVCCSNDPRRRGRGAQMR